jgi:hypothetical protein
MTTSLGDLDLDRDVDLFDLLAIANGGRLNADLPAGWQDGDVNYDGRLTLFDLLVISGSGQYATGRLGQPSQPAASSDEGSAPAGPLDPRQQAFARLAAGISWESLAAISEDDDRGDVGPLLQ